ncbi:glycosyltransferase [Candidatus Woesearchaeota archaeon]|nr:glycosyltransferase [Candidatus Woesearchaeota archaeon]
MGKADYLFEVSWEVCNKVGGIYTVIMSKAAKMVGHYGDGYFSVGPYFPGKSVPEFIEKEPPKEIEKVFEAMAQKGIECHYGIWLVKGEPKVILVNGNSLFSIKDELLKHLWEDFGIDSLSSGSDYFDPVIWSTAVGMFIEEFSVQNPGSNVVGHFHEWLAGAGLLYLRKHNAKAATVFTTHATMLGRSIAGSGQDLYSMLGHFNPDNEAKWRGVNNKFTIERASAQNAHCFTTVSDITGIEAEAILGKKPDIIVPNGLDMEYFPSYEEVAYLHKINRSKLKEMVAFHFLPYQQFDLDDTFIYYIFGRYEFKNKGIDVFIKALSQLNDRLRADNSKRTIIAYFWIPAYTRGMKQQLLENKAYFGEINNSIYNHMDSIKQKLISDIISGQDMTKVNLFDQEFLLEARKLAANFKKQGNPPLVTHNIDEANDSIVKAFMDARLYNNADDRVKVVFHPAYLTGTDGLLDLKYYDAMVAGHLGVYPSYYEPWGYTPLESAAWGVPAITTDLAGFGKWINDNKKKDDKGIVVISRLGKNDGEVVRQLSDAMYDYSQLNRHGRVERKINAKELADWGNLVKFYFDAHNFALKKLS